MNRSRQLPPHPILSGVIAVVGCDGSGKSTLTTDLFTHLHDKGPVELLYLGQSSGKIAGWIRGLPVIGAAFARYLVRRAERAHDRKAAAPDTATALVVHLLSCWRAHKFRRMLALARGGAIVIADRYPQADVPGFYFDGPGFVATGTDSWLVGRLAAREMQLYQWMASYIPALVIRLNIDADTARVRKPDHKLAMLQQKVAVIPNLQFNGARILDLDGRDPYAQVLAEALKEVRATIGSPADRGWSGLVAVVGCDGTGKSTLTSDLLATLRLQGPVERRYLGLVSGETGNRIKQLPVVGVWLERYLAAKARRAQDMRQKLPGTGTALVMYLFSLGRVAQLRRVLRLARRGVLVIVDRYPQAEIPGFHFDGPGLSGDCPDNWLVRKLAVRERKLYEWMAEQKPDLIIRLNIDPDTAHARKPDHDLTELRDKISVMQRLHFNGAQILDLDARAPYPEVLGAALGAINATVQPPCD